MATTPNSLTPLLKKINLPWLLATLGTGAGIMAIVSRLAANEPKDVINVVGGWGPLFVLASFLIWVLDRRMGESAQSQQKLADAMQQIAQKDDIRGREMELGMATMGRNMERLLQHMVEMRNEIVSLRKPGAGN